MRDSLRRTRRLLACTHGRMGLPFSKMGILWWDQVEAWIGDQNFVSGPGEHLNEDVKEAIESMTLDLRLKLGLQIRVKPVKEGTKSHGTGPVPSPQGR